MLRGDSTLVGGVGYPTSLHNSGLGATPPKVSAGPLFVRDLFELIRSLSIKRYFPLWDSKLSRMNRYFECRNYQSGGPIDTRLTLSPQLIYTLYGKYI